MKPNTTLLIHGPFGGNALPEIINSFCAWPAHKETGIVLVVYTDDVQKTQELLNQMDNCPPYKMVVVKDLINPGFFNINRQLVTVSAGLREIPEDHFVIKLRNDQWVDFSLLEQELTVRDWLDGNRDQIITTNCFTRRDRLYHPSDMFLCGWQPTLNVYYSAPQMSMTQLDCENSIIKKCSEGVPFSRAFVCPEIYLFQNYLRTKGWELQYTEEDSYQALKQYCRLINSWEICLRWKKDRTPYKGEGAVILPQYWHWPPFPGMEDEDISCYLRSDFEGEFTRQDKRYLKESKAVWNRFEKKLRAGVGETGDGYTGSRVKLLMKKTWSCIRQVVRIISWFLPHGLVIIFQRIWHAESLQRARVVLKQRIKRLLR